LDHGLPEKVKLLLVACKQLRKQKFWKVTDIASDALSMEKWAVLQITECFLQYFAEKKYYQRRSKRLFKLILVFQGNFDVRYIRVFCKFPG